MGAVEDKLEILDLIARYSYAIDGQDPLAYADVFTEDGVFHSVGLDKEVVIRGRDDLIAFAKGVYARRGDSQTRHRQSCTMFVDLTTERARTRTYLLLTYAHPGKLATITGTGVYEDEIVRTPEGWRIRKRFIASDPPRPPQLQS